MTRNDESADSPDGRASRRDFLRIAGGSLAAGGTASLAGCPGAGEITTTEATPTVLYPDGQRLVGLSESRVEELTRTVSPTGVDEVSLTSYLAVHGQPTGTDQPLPMRFGVPEPSAHVLGILAMPAPSVLGQELNPLAEKPLGELLTDERGRRFLDRIDAVDAPEFRWSRGPTRVGTREAEIMGTSTTAESYLGIAAGGEDERTVLVTLARVEEGDEVALVGEGTWRATPPEPLDGDTDCADDRCQLSTDSLSRTLDRFVSGVPYVDSCPELARQLDSDISSVCGGGVPDAGPIPTFGITDARIVQHVENTQVEDTGSPVRVYHQESPDPDLVEGENSAVVFEFDTLENLDAMGANEDLEVAVYTGTGGSNGRYRREGTITFDRSDLQSIDSGSEHTITVLHRLSNNGNSANRNPVFELDSGRVRVSPVTRVLGDTSGVSETVTVPPNRIRRLDALKVGFVVLQDAPPDPFTDPGDRYGTVGGRPRDNGLPQNPRRTFESATEYLRRAYPGDVVTYLLDPPRTYQAHGLPLVGIPNDFSQAYMRLQKFVLYRTNNLTNDGTLRLDGRNGTAMANRITANGFDAVVAIVPGVAPGNPNAQSYYDFHLPGADPDGMAFLPLHAVSMAGATAGGGDQEASQVVAQEVGHYFQDYLADNYLEPAPRHPMAQRRFDPVAGVAQKQAPSGPNSVQRPIDKLHARHLNSDLRDRDTNNDGTVDVNNPPDEPGVVSVAYDLEDGFANLQRFRNPNGNFSVDGPPWNDPSVIEGVESYMSYTGRSEQTWADERIHRRLVNVGAGGWTPPNTNGSGSRTIVLAGTGTITDDGVRYEYVNAVRGRDRYPDNETHPVEVALLGPDGEVLARANVRAGFVMTHLEEAPRLPSFRLPFETRGVRVRTTYDGTTTSMNPIVRSVRDAVERVPERGFADDPEAARAGVDEALTAVEGLMDEGAYDEAATVMGEDVRARVRSAMVEYDARLGPRTREEMTTLVDLMAERLATVADTG